MTMFNQYWQTRLPTTLFEQTQYEADQLFYATFPAARDAACNATFDQSIYDHPSRVDYSTLHEAIQPLAYDIRNELYFAYPDGLHPQQPFPSHHHIQSSYHYPPRPIENDSPLYSPPEHPYHHQYSSDPTSQHIPQSHASPVPPRQPAYPVYQPSHISPQVNADTKDTVSDGRLETPSYGFRQLNRNMKPPTLKFPNNCQLGVMRLDRLLDQSHLDSPQLSNRSHPSPSETTPVSPSPSTPPPTEFLLNSAPSPSIGLSSLPSKTSPERKPPLACLFCRGRKIACGAPLPGIKKTCNQCQKRGLTCYYPTESRRGMRKKKPPSDDPEGEAEEAMKRKKKKEI